MTGFSPERTDILNAISKRLSLDVALSRPAPVQGNHIIVPVVHIDTCRVYFRQIEILFPCILHLNASGYHIAVRKYCVEKFHPHPHISVLADKFERLALPFCAKSCREPRKRRFPFHNLMRYIREHGTHIAARCPNAKAAFPQIAHSPRRIFKRKTIIKSPPLPVILAGHKRFFLGSEQIRRLGFL